MAAGYFQAGKSGDLATFELFLRRLPPGRNFVLAAGLAQAVEYLRNLRFTAEEIAYLRGLEQFSRVTPAFFQELAGLRFTGDLFAMPEGTPLFAGEPILTVRAPLMEAQIVETYLLSMVGFQSMIATKAARVAGAAGPRPVIEYGTRRAHSPEAGVLAARAAFIGGCTGTSNVEAGFRYGIPVFGTSAHSWVQSFHSEREAFRQLQTLLGNGTVYLVDTYDTVEGARRAVELGRPLWGVRLDSGNLQELSRKVRQVLDQAGLSEAKIMTSGDLNEHRILELAASGAPIDAFGVGTELATSADAPSLSVVYKLVELESGGIRRYTAKYSENKMNLPGAKQVFRYHDHDLVACHWECPDCGYGPGESEALLRPVLLGGELIEPLPTAAESRAYAAQCLARLPRACRSVEFDESASWRVEFSSELMQLAHTVRLEEIEREGVP